MPRGNNAWALIRVIKEGTLASRTAEKRDYRHRSSFEAHDAYLQQFEQAGMVASKNPAIGRNTELNSHPFYGVQYHPELKSR